MELDDKNLGRLRRVAEPRHVWVSESGDFTPWLAANIDVLADELGMILTVTGTEVPVGEFRLDIRAEDETGRVVVIENQLERTDHTHMGQCMVYASGLDASTVIWVAPKFRDDFRQALDWLNEHTDLGVSFFGVEVGVVQIGESGPRAPVFDVVSRPNDWQKSVKGAGTTDLAGGQASVTPLNAQRQDFFAEVLAEVTKQIPAIRLPTRSRGSWIPFASGPFGNWGLAAAAVGQIRVEAYIDSGNRTVNKRLFDELHAAAEEIELSTGVELSWERLDDRRASRVGAYRSVDLDDEAELATAKAWASTTVVSLYQELNERMRTRAKAIRASVAADASRTDEGRTPLSSQR